MRKKPTRELVALGSQAAPGASARRSTSRSLPSLPKGPMRQQFTRGWLATACPGQSSAASTLPFARCAVPALLIFTGGLAPPGSGMQKPCQQTQKAAAVALGIYKILPEEQMKS